MEMIQGQLMYVAASFVEGVFLMFLYDFIRAFRMKVKHGRVWILIEDWLFWLLAAFFVFPMIRLIFRPYVWIFKKIKGIQKKHLKS